MSIVETTWESDQHILTMLRHKVFVEEQRVPVELEIDEHDPDARHWLMRDGDRAIATIRLLHDGTVGRMAVLANYRRRGLGKALMDTCIAAAKEQQLPELTLMAQCQAQGFYEKMGFEAYGDVVLDAGIPHVHMKLQLAPLAPTMRLRRERVDDIANGILDIAFNARRRLDIYSHNLQPEWFASEELVQRISLLARHLPNSQIRLLIKNDRSLREHHHPLVDLCSRLSSSIGLRVISRQQRDTDDEQFMIADTNDILVIPGEEGSVAWVSKGLPPIARDYQQRFTQMWEFAKPSVWLRPLN